MERFSSAFDNEAQGNEDLGRDATTCNNMEAFKWLEMPEGSKF